MAWVPLQEWLPGYEPYLDTISSIVLSTHAGTESAGCSLYASGDMIP